VVEVLQGEKRRTLLKVLEMGSSIFSLLTPITLASSLEGMTILSYGLILLSNNYMFAENQPQLDTRKRSVDI
jgi:hypothetical protein